MPQHHSTSNHQLEPRTERAIRFCLRTLGMAALITCILFWLSLFLTQ